MVLLLAKLKNSDDEREEVIKFLSEWIHVFASNLDCPPLYKGPKLSIPTNGPPRKFQPRRVNPVREEEIKRQIKVMLQNGIIKPTNSPWASPVVLAPKKDGTLRFCVDYRYLNSVTIKDSYPMPRIDDMLDALGNQNANIFSTCDLCLGYYCVGIDDADQEKTCFSSQSGTFAYTRMPFGLTGAPGHFVRAMNNVLAAWLWKCCLVFVDDLLIWSPSYEQHFADLANVFGCLVDMGMTLKFTKCHFFKQEVEYLGYTIRKGEIHLNNNKIQAIIDFPPPTTLKGLQRALGMFVWFRRHLANFSITAAPLYELLKKGVNPEDWKIHIDGSEQNIAFNTLKKQLMTKPILKMPNYNLPFIVTFDASYLGTAGCLWNREGNFEYPICYTSKTLNDSQKKWSGSYIIETLAFVRALRAFKHYLTDITFTVATDCSALSAWKTTKEIPAHVAKWVNEIESHSFRIEHRPSAKMVVADALSEFPRETDQRSINAFLLGVDSEHIWKAQDSDEMCRTIYDYLYSTWTTPWGNHE